MAGDDPEIHLYWATGCTSCLRAKEFLERNDVPFVSHNVVADREILDEMEASGLPRQVPVVERGEVWVDAQSLEDVARIVGVEYDAAPLPVADLYRRLDLVLDATRRYVQSLSGADLDRELPNRPRTVGELVYHTISVAESFLEHEDGSPLERYKPEPEWANRSTDSLATYGRNVHVRLRDWYEGPGSERDWSETANVYYGEPTVHEFLERTTWHAGQHTRQLEWVLVETFDESVDSLEADVWEGLPMPEKVWADTRASP